MANTLHHTSVRTPGRRYGTARRLILMTFLPPLCCKLRNLNCRVPHPSDMKRNSPGTSIVWQLTPPNATPAYAFNAAPLLTLPTLTLRKANTLLIHASLYAMDSCSFLSTTANAIRDSLPPMIFIIILSFLPFRHHSPQTQIPRPFNCH